MNEELLNLIQQLIAALQHEQTELQEGSVAWNSREKAIQHFSKQLKVMSGEISASVQQVSRLERQFRDLFSAINTGATTAGKAVNRLSVGGMQFHLPQFQRLTALKNEPLPVIQKPTEVQERITPTPQPVSIQVSDFQTRRRNALIGNQRRLPSHIRQTFITEAESLLDEILSADGPSVGVNEEGNFRRFKSGAPQWYREMYDAQTTGRRSHFKQNVIKSLRDIIVGVESPKSPVAGELKELIAGRLTNGGGPAGADPGILWFLGMKDEAAEAINARGSFFEKNENLLNTFGDTHTKLTDGLATLEQMLDAASGLGYAYYAVTDHAPNLFMQRMTDEKMLAQREELRALQDRYPKMTLLHGSELNIDQDGEVDWGPEFLEGFDVCVASVHSYFNQSKAEMTRRLIRAMENPHVNVIGHPTARLINRRDAIELDHDEVFKAAARTGTALEINAYPDRLDLKDEHIAWAKRYGVKFAVDTDSHATTHLELMRYGVATAQRGWLTKDDVINAWPLSKLRRFLRKGR